MSETCTIPVMNALKQFISIKMNRMPKHYRNFWQNIYCLSEGFFFHLTKIRLKLGLSVTSSLSSDLNISATAFGNSIIILEFPPIFLYNEQYNATCSTNIHPERHLNNIREIQYRLLGHPTTIHPNENVLMVNISYATCILCILHKAGGAKCETCIVPLISAPGVFAHQIRS